MKRLAAVAVLLLALLPTPALAYTGAFPYCGHGATKSGSYSQHFVKHTTLADGRHRHRYVKKWRGYPYAWTTRTCR